MQFTFSSCSYLLLVTGINGADHTVFRFQDLISSQKDICCESESSWKICFLSHLTAKCGQC